MRQKIQLFTLFATILADFTGFSLVIAIFPAIIMHNTPAFLAHGATLFTKSLTLGLLTSSYPAAQFFGAPLFGSLSDQWGRKKMMQVTLIGSALSYLVTALAMTSCSLILLFASRIAAGLFAGNLTLAQAAIGDLSTNTTRTRNFAYVSMAGSLAFIMGPALGGRLADAFSITTPFLVACALFVAVLLVFSWVFDETICHGKREDKISILQGFRHIGTIKDLPRLHWPLASFFVIRTGYWMFMLFFSAYLVTKFQFSRTQAADTYIMLAIWSTVMVNTIVRWLSKLQRNFMLILLTTFTIAATVLIISLSSTASLIYAMLPLFAFAITGFYTYFMSFLSKEAAENQGVAMGIATSLQSVAQVIAPLIAGMIMATHPNLPLLLSAFLTFIGGFLMIKKSRHRML